MFKVILVFLIGFFVLWAAHANPSPQNAPNLKERVIHAAIATARESWIDGDADAFASLFTSDGELIVPGSRWSGQTAIRKAAADFAASTSSVKIEIRRTLVEGDRAAIEWHWEDTEKATGKQNRADDAIFIDFKQGRIERWREYIDTQTPTPQS